MKTRQGLLSWLFDAVNTQSFELLQSESPHGSDATPNMSRTTWAFFDLRVAIWHLEVASLEPLADGSYAELMESG